MTTKKSDLDPIPTTVESEICDSAAADEIPADSFSDGNQIFTVSEPAVNVKVENQGENPPFSVAKSQESTRAKIAWTFTIFFLVMVFFGLTGPFIIDLVQPNTFPDTIEASKSITANITSILAGPFGFIVGFYFKQNPDDF